MGDLPTGGDVVRWVVVILWFVVEGAGQGRAAPGQNTQSIESEIPALERTLPVDLVFSLGAPSIINLGAILPLSEKWEVSLRGGIFWLPLPSDRLVRVWNLDGDVRVFPFWRWAFFGVTVRGFEFSFRTRSAFFSSSGTADTTATAALGGLYLVPHMGTRFFLSRRLLLGFSAGVQLPLFYGGGVSAETDNPTPESSEQAASLKQASLKVGRHYAGTILPSVTLIEFTWLF